MQGLGLVRVLKEQKNVVEILFNKLWEYTKNGIES